MEESKLTVDQVKAAANQQISILYKKLEEANLENAYKRLDYLFEIVKNQFPEEMKNKAFEEIKEIMFGKPEDVGESK